MQRISIYFLYFLLLSIVIYLFVPNNSDRDSSIEEMSLEEELANDLKRNPGFSVGVDMPKSSQAILQSQGKRFERFAEYFTPLAAGVTEQNLSEYVMSGSEFIKDKKTFLSGPRKLREICPGVYVDAEIYDNTGKQVVFKDIKSNVDYAECEIIGLRVENPYSGILGSYDTEESVDELLKQEQARTEAPTTTYGKGLPRDSDTLIPNESSYPSWETGEYESINPQRMKDVVIDISNIALESKKRTPYWGRLPGTPEDEKTMNYIENKLIDLGFSIEKKDVFISKEWRPKEWLLGYTYNNEFHSITSAFPTGENIKHLDSNFNGELVWVGLGSEADFLGKDIKGKAVVIYSFFVPGGRSHSASNRAGLFYANERASKKGASLIINIMGVPGDGMFAGGAFHGTSGKPTTSYDAPVITISQDEGFLLRDRMLKEKIIVDFSLKIDVIENLKTTYMIAKLDGVSKEEIFLGAHTDGYFEGAMDNASGIAVGLEMAEYFAKLKKSERKRSIVFFLYPDHHHGEYSVREVEEYYDWDKVAVVLTLEHPSQSQLYWFNEDIVVSNAIGSFRWNVTGSDRLEYIFKQRLKENGVSIYNYMTDKPKLTDKAPGFHIIDHVIYHTTFDIPELVPAEGMKRATKAFLGIVDDVNELSLQELR